MWSVHELIVAPATVRGSGARAVVRFSGDGLDRLGRPAVVGGLAGQWFWNHVLDAMRVTVGVKRAAAEAAIKANRQKKGETMVAKAKK